MKKGINVSWKLEGFEARGSGVTLSDEENGYVLVAVNNFGYGSEVPALKYHPVIWCAVTWLMVEVEAPTA
jgi:hypothetical protein